METTHLIKKLEIAARKSLELVDKEREKQAHGAYFPLNTRHPRVLDRETFYQHEHVALLTVIDQVESFADTVEEEDKEEVVYLARKLMAEVNYPWIRRKVLEESTYREMYFDKDFEPYAEGLPHKQQALCMSPVSALGLSLDLEKELIEELRHKVSLSMRKEYSPQVKDVITHRSELHHMFKDDWSKKAHLITFRLFELGLIENGVQS